MLIMLDAPGSRLIFDLRLEIRYGEDPVGTQKLGFGDTVLLNQATKAF